MPHAYVVASLSGYMVDRIVPSLISGTIVSIFGWCFGLWLTRTMKTHVEVTTTSQTEQIKQETAAQTRALEDMTAKQTEELKPLSDRRKPGDPSS